MPPDIMNHNVLFNTVMAVVGVSPVSIVERWSHINEIAATSTSYAIPVVISSLAVRIVRISRVLHLIFDLAFSKVNIAPCASVASYSSLGRLGLLDDPNLVHSVNIDYTVL
jgi:hypothetical protein